MKMPSATSFRTFSIALYWHFP